MSTKLKGDSEEEKRKFQEKQRQLEKERIKKEQQQKKELLKKVRAQAQEDKKRREEQAKQKLYSDVPKITNPTPSQNSTTSTTTKPKKEEKTKTETPKIEKNYKECLIQIRMFNGTTLRETFPVDSNLLDVAKIVQEKCGEDIRLGEFTILTPFPKKEFELKDFKITTLKDAGLVPKGSITLQKLESKGKVIKGEGFVHEEEEPDYNSDDDPMDDPFPQPIMPIVPPSTGNIPQVEKPIITPEDDNYERNLKLLCSVWLFSITESPEGTNILVYRPTNFEFEQEDNTRPVISFIDDGSFSSVTVIEGKKTTSNGNWKLSKNGTTLKITTEGQTKEYEIATITDEVLILS
eukprot:gene2587-3548_t